MLLTGLGKSGALGKALAQPLAGFFKAVKIALCEFQPNRIADRMPMLPKQTHRDRIAAFQGDQQVGVAAQPFDMGDAGLDTRIACHPNAFRPQPKRRRTVPSTLPGKKFIDGDPRNPATNWFTGSL